MTTMLIKPIKNFKFFLNDGHKKSGVVPLNDVLVPKLRVFKAKTTKTIIYIKGQSNLQCSFLAEYSSYFRHNLK